MNRIYSLFLVLFLLIALVEPSMAIQNLRARQSPQSVLTDDDMQPEVEEVEKRLLNKLDTLPKGDKRRCMIRSWLGAIRYANGDYSEAISCLQDEARECESHMPLIPHIYLHKHLGDCFYAQNNFDRAEKEYSEALSLASKAPANAGFRPGSTVDSILLWTLHEDLGACYCRTKEYAAAEKQYLEVARIQESDATPDKVSQGWTYLMLSDAYRNMGNAEKSQAALRHSIETFRGVTRFDLVAERRRHSPTEPKDLWSRLDRCNRDLPLISWLSPNPKAIILCIHGLGLHNGSFAPFGRQMRTRGYDVYAMDVRGFGSWTKAKGEERVDFEQCVEDVRTALNAIHEANPRLPIFLLGESMGGAIALHAAAKYPELLSGVISSVPAGDRQNEKAMDLKIAFNFLFDRDKNLDIGDDLAKRVTEKEQLRQRWEHDPRARLSVSARELVHFDFFMKQNEKIAADVKTPTLITQGARGALVKPTSTIELYNKLGATDKDLLVIGQAEHLIFEVGQFSDLLLNGLSAWLDAHLTPAKPTPTPPAVTIDN
jgi:acylglycerol lipase